MAEVVNDAVSAGELSPPPRRLPAPSQAAAAVTDLVPTPLPVDLVDIPERSLLMWIALIGAINFELFGHLNNVVIDYTAYFDRAMAVASEAIGLRLPLPER